MTDTAVSYGNRANARRAAEKLLTAGIAPAVDYGIKERDDGRFEIVWKTGNRTPAITGEIETEITTAAAAEPSAAVSELTQPAAPAATEATRAEPTRSPQRKLERRRRPPLRPPRRLVPSRSPRRKATMIPSSRRSRHRG